MVHPGVIEFFARVSERTGVNEGWIYFLLLSFLHLLVLVFPNTYQQKANHESKANFKRSDFTTTGSNLPLQNNILWCSNCLNNVIGIIDFTVRCHVVFSLERRNHWRALHECSVLLYKCYLLKLQYFRNFHSHSRVETNQCSLTSWSIGVAYSWYFFITTLILIPTANTAMRLYLT